MAGDLKQMSGIRLSSPSVIIASCIVVLAVYFKAHLPVITEEDLSDENALPIIDLSPEFSKVEAEKLRKVCLQHGFFYVKNHGVADNTVRRAFEQTRRLFDLPAEAKQKLLQNRHNRGYTPLQEEILDPKNQKEGDLKEGFYIGAEVDSESKLAKEFPLFGPNQWPEEVSDSVPGFRADMMTYYDNLVDLGRNVSALIAESLHLPRDFFLPHLTQPVAILRLLRYLPVKSEVSKGRFGAGAHSDYGLITILATDDVGGLQIESRGGKWIDVNPIPGTFVINIGDMLARWTNDAYKSTRHRVVLPYSGTIRYSIPFFFEPNHDTEVKCVPSICGNSFVPTISGVGDSSKHGDGQIVKSPFSNTPQAPKYAPTTSGQYLLDKYDSTHAGFDSER